MKHQKWVDSYVCTNQVCCIKGVAIIFKKPSKAIILEEYVDLKGRWVAVKIKIEGNPYIIARYYGPNTDDPVPLQTLYTQLIDVSVPIILGGDFNIMLDPKNYRYRPGKALNLPKMREWLSRFREDLGLVDAWKEKGNQSNKFTYKNHKYGHASRIDFFLIEKTISNNVNKVEHVPAHLSDHSLVYIEINLGLSQGETRWTLDRTLLLNEQEIDR